MESAGRRSPATGAEAREVTANIMWATLESWQLSQLQRLASLDPERVEKILNTIWSQDPDLFKELVISAIDQDALTVEQASGLLDQTKDLVIRDLIEFRNRSQAKGFVVVHDCLRKAACVADGCVAVWEIVRESRKHGSMEELQYSFPSLALGDLTVALRYAEEHQEEIEHDIRNYETLLEQIRVEYPYMKEAK